MKLKLNKYSLPRKPLKYDICAAKCFQISANYRCTRAFFPAPCGEAGQGPGPGGRGDRTITGRSVFWTALLSESTPRGGRSVFGHPRTLIKMVCNGHGRSLRCPQLAARPPLPNGTGSKGPHHESMRGRGKAGRFVLGLKDKFILAPAKYVNTFLRLSPKSSRLPPVLGAGTQRRTSSLVMPP